MTDQYLFLPVDGGVSGTWSSITGSVSRCLGRKVFVAVKGELHHLLIKVPIILQIPVPENIKNYPGNRLKTMLIRVP
jgi:hypothetical protein